MGSPLQGSGPISLSDIRSEMGGSNPEAISEYYADVISFPIIGPFYGPNSGSPIEFSDFYQAERVAVINLTISSNTQFYDIESACRSAGWNGIDTVQVFVTVNSGVYVYGSRGSQGADSGSGISGGNGGNGGLAMRTGNFGGDLYEPINLTINGYVIGGGGGGGGGGGTDDFTGSNAYGGSGGRGGNGGIGLRVDGDDSVTISGSGYLYGGGGGGGGGGGLAYAVSTYTSSGCTKDGSGGCCVTKAYLLGGGGGGGGAARGYGGHRGTHRDNDGVVVNGGTGGTAGLTNGGSGGFGASGGSSQCNSVIRAGYGGSGGNGGSNGNSGYYVGSVYGQHGNNGSRGTRGYYLYNSARVTYSGWTGVLRGRVL